MSTINENHMMYDSWDMECNRQNVFFIFSHFFPFYPLIIPAEKWKYLKKKKKKSCGDIIILHKCTKNHDHMLYCSWDMGHDRSNCYFSFWTIFCPFIPLTAPKIKISKKLKRLEISSFYTSVPKLMIICCTVPEIWHVMNVISFHVGLLFALLPP